MGFFDFFTDRTPAEPAEIRLVAFVSGKVQGVGFRWWCAGTAKPMGLTGYAENLDDGRVKVVAEVLPPPALAWWMCCAVTTPPGGLMRCSSSGRSRAARSAASAFGS